VETRLRTREDEIPVEQFRVRTKVGKLVEVVRRPATFRRTRPLIVVVQPN
jgi:hypothetical protein